MGRRTDTQLEGINWRIRNYGVSEKGIQLNGTPERSERQTARSAFGVLLVLLTACSAAGPKSSGPKFESLDDYFRTNDQAAEKARFEHQRHLEEKKIEACMRDEGFRYVAYVQKDNWPTVEVPKRGEEVAFKRKHGYNYAENLERFITLPLQTNADPNIAIAGEMIESTRKAYEKGLDGCRNLASKDQNDAWKPLESKMANLEKRIAADATVAKLNSKFISCMNKAGISISKEDDIAYRLGNKQQYLVSNLQNPVQSVAYPSPNPETTPEKTVKDFRAYELEVANTDANCRTQTDIDKIYRIRLKYEKAFVGQNQELLQRYKTAGG